MLWGVSIYLSRWKVLIININISFHIGTLGMCVESPVNSESGPTFQKDPPSATFVSQHQDVVTSRPWSSQVCEEDTVTLLFSWNSEATACIYDLSCSIFLSVLTTVIHTLNNSKGPQLIFLENRSVSSPQIPEGRGTAFCERDGHMPHTSFRNDHSQWHGDSRRAR